MIYIKMFRNELIAGIAILVLVSVLMVYGFESVNADTQTPVVSPLPAFELPPISPLPVFELPPLSDDNPVTWENVLVRMHVGQWFGWSDSSNKSYETLIILDPKYPKPSKVELQSLMVALQNKWDLRKIRLADFANRRAQIESRLLAGTHSQQDMVDYLRILGGF